MSFDGRVAFVEGMSIVLHSLKARPDLNGRYAIVVSPFDPETGRVGVHLIGSNKLGLNVKPENMNVYMPPESKLEDKFSSDTCAICMEPLSQQPQGNNLGNKALVCGHVFHYQCFLHFAGNTPGQWAFSDKPVTRDPRVGPVSTALYLACPMCRDVQPAMEFADADTTVEFRTIFKELLTCGLDAPTGLQYATLVEDFKRSGLPATKFFDALDAEEFEE